MPRKVGRGHGACRGGTVGGAKFPTQVERELKLSARAAQPALWVIFESGAAFGAVHLCPSNGMLLSGRGGARATASKVYCGRGPLQRRVILHPLRRVQYDRVLRALRSQTTSRSAVTVDTSAESSTFRAARR